MDCKSGESRLVIFSGVTGSDIFITFGGIGVGLGFKNVFWMVTVGEINGVVDATVGEINGVVDATLRDSIFSADNTPIINNTRETDTSNTPIIMVEIPTHFEATMAYHLPETDKITLSIYPLDKIISVVTLNT